MSTFQQWLQRVSAQEALLLLRARSDQPFSRVLALMHPGGDGASRRLCPSFHQSSFLFLSPPALKNHAQASLRAETYFQPPHC